MRKNDSLIFFGEIQYFECQSLSKEASPIVFTFTPCGNAKTLEFMKWLGIHIPRWLENELVHSNDMLEKSVDLCEEVFQGLWSYTQEKGIPMGVNIESVSTRKVEIEAASELVRRVRKTLKQSL